MQYGGQSLTKPLKRALVHSPGDEYNRQNWTAYGYAGEPNVEKAKDQHSAFLQLLEAQGVVLEQLGEGKSLQSLATTDPALMLNAGAVILNSGKRDRRCEAHPMARRLVDLGVPIVGWLTKDAYCDGGDLLWLNERELVVGRSYRTNRKGIENLRAILKPLDVDLYDVAMPHWRGPAEVLHLMSAISLVNEKLAVVFDQPLPLSLIDLLEDRGIEMLAIPEEEFATQACNILSIDARNLIMCKGNSKTEAMLKERDLKVHIFDGSEFCARRGAGPTCHVLPLLRTAY